MIKSLLKFDDADFIINENSEISTEKTNEIIEKCNQIKSGVPLQYITNNQDFFGLNFYVDENVLIPQPDTEILVEKTIEICKKIDKKNKEPKIKILDLCTGSGAIAISIKNELREKAEIDASDISKDALKIAKKNAENILGKNKIEFILSDMLENIKKKYDIIVSNPPYIRTDEIGKLEKDVQNEPKLALDGGKDGLKFYKKIRMNIKNYLVNGGYVLLEIGFDQKKDVQKLFENSECIQDFAKNDRVIIWKNKE